MAFQPGTFRFCFKSQFLGKIFWKKMTLNSIVRGGRDVIWLSGGGRLSQTLSDSLDKGSEKGKGEPIPGDHKTASLTSYGR